MKEIGLVQSWTSLIYSGSHIAVGPEGGREGTGGMGEGGRSGETGVRCAGQDGGLGKGGAAVASVEDGTPGATSLHGADVVQPRIGGGEGGGRTRGHLGDGQRAYGVGRIVGGQLVGGLS